MNTKQLSRKLKELENANFSEVIAFLKTNNYYKDRRQSAIFWQSNIPTFYIQEFTKSNIWEDLLFGYFSSDKNINTSFLNLAIKYGKPHSLIKIVKVTLIFNSQPQWETFKAFKLCDNLKLKAFYQELDFIRRNLNYWKEIAKPFEAKLVQFSSEDILIQITSFFQKFKNYSKKTANNRLLITSYEAQLINIIDEFLTIKSKNKIALENNTYDNSEFKIELKNELPPIKPDVFTFPTEIISDKKRTFREIIEFYLSKNENEYQINKFLSGLADFEDIDGLSAELITNNKNALYRKTLEKGIYEENYLDIINEQTELNKITSLKYLLDKKIALKKLTSINYFKFYNLPISIFFKENQHFSMEDSFAVLQCFSNLCMPQGKNSINNVNFYIPTPSDFLKLFNSDYLVRFDKDEFVKNISIYFKIEFNEALTIFNFLITDTDILTKFDIKSRPFIKIKNNIYWLSAFLQNRKWEVALHRKLIKEKLINHQIVSANSEKFIATLFQKAGFNALASFHYNFNNQRGEIDTIAYKDKTLFLIELKNTYLEENMLRNNEYSFLKYDSLAARQLSKAVHFVKNNFNELKETEELGIDCELKDLTIKTIIVSNIFQSDNLLIEDEHYKISLFELAIILRNDLNKILERNYESTLFDMPNLKIPYQMIENISNSNNPDFKKDSSLISEEDKNLWTNKNYCSPNDLLTAIEQNKVFKHLDNQRNYPIEYIELKEFDPKDKHLS